MSSAPETYAQLRSLLQSRYETYAPGQQRIADVLLSDPEGTAFRSVAQTADRAQVHRSSVVRFAHTVGLKGYPAIVSLCRHRLAEEAHLVSRFANAERHRAPETLLQKTVEHEKENLVRTFTRITEEQWLHTVQLISTAERIHIMGLRKCLAPAELLSYLLNMVRRDVHLVAPTTGMLVDELRRFRAPDVFVGFSIARYTAETVRAMEHAREEGLSTIALTDTPASPLAKIAETSFFVDSGGVTVLKSVSAFISLVQALATAVATHNGARSREELLTDERLLQEFSVYRA